jgi:hypothetical protein
MNQKSIPVDQHQSYVLFMLIESKFKDNLQ